MANQLEGVSGRPVIFVCHSLGRYHCQESAWSVSQDFEQSVNLILSNATKFRRWRTPRAKQLRKPPACILSTCAHSVSSSSALLTTAPARPPLGSLQKL